MDKAGDLAPTSSAERLSAFLDAASAVALVEVAKARGSTPREQGARMLVSPDAILGTIGGGQLEYMAIDKARQGLAAAIDSTMLDIPLGPEIGQCCGGRVAIGIRRVDRKLREELVAAAGREEALMPRVYIFGGGHVGQALAASLALLPLVVAVVESRAEVLESLPAGVARHLTSVPEEVVRAAPAGSAFVVLTHDHALDFLIVAEALKRGDAAYVGMIGSKTKKATFRSWFLKAAGGSEAAFSRLVTPIGGEAVHDKRPAVIAALAAAEMVTALARTGALARTAAG